MERAAKINPDSIVFFGCIFGGIILAITILLA